LLISARIEIDAAHCLADHSSKCYNIHGHRYIVEAELEGPVLDQVGTSGNGMVLDFSTLTELMQAVIHQPADHGLIMDVNDSRINIFYGDPTIIACAQKAIDRFGYSFGRTENYRQKIMLIDAPPTAEHLAVVWARALNNAVLEEGYTDHAITQLKVWETPKYAAVWRAVKDLKS
jgi:6-pyruvoyltetrahydropterin/6-carboxytetrahydropterin synthase